MAAFGAASAGAGPLSGEPLQPLPLKAPDQNPAIVHLGKRLFHDPRLSKDNAVACSSCHAMELGGADGQPKSVGIGGSVGDVNAPTVFNSGYNFVQFWDGRARSLEDQVGGPIHNPKEMASNWTEVLAKLKVDAAVVAESRRAFGKEIDIEVIQRSIAAFERSLVTPNSRFDRYLLGDQVALSETERRGYREFKMYGCSSCHQGANVGGNMFQKLGIMHDYFADARKTRSLTEADRGRFNVTKQPTDLHVFRVPSLRNVELTAPYFHDGSQRTLEEAVRAMAHYQLGRKVPSAHVNDIVAFLRTLTGELPKVEGP